MSQDLGIEELKTRLIDIKKRGWIPSKRRGNTGIGYTLESLLGISENNCKDPDFGQIEIKSQRQNSSSMVTLFTFNKGIWVVKQADVIKKYGYRDTNERDSLYSTVNGTIPNAQGLLLTVDNSLKLSHLDGTGIAEWPGEVLTQRFKEKLSALVLVEAETRENSDGREEFNYQKAYFLTEPNTQNFLDLIRAGHIMVDLRMHIRNNGSVKDHRAAIRTEERRLTRDNSSVRNHGTAFRIEERYLNLCFANREQIL